MLLEERDPAFRGGAESNKSEIDKMRLIK